MADNKFQTPEAMARCVPMSSLQAVLSGNPVHPDQTAAGTGGRRFPAADGLSGGAATGRVYPDRAGTELRTGSGADAGLE